MYSRFNEKPFINEDMKNLKRRTQREYEKRGKSEKYKNMKRCFKTKFEAEASKYKERIIEDVKTGNRNSAYSALRKVGVRPGENIDNTFTLPSHSESHLSAGESVELIADHFSLISQNYDPINLDNFPPNMKEALKKPCLSVVPVLEEYQVYKEICKAK